jgi:hypothetical protein
MLRSEQDNEILYQVMYNEVGDEQMDTQSKVISVILVCLAIGALVLFIYTF